MSSALDSSCSYVAKDWFMTMGNVYKRRETSASRQHWCTFASWHWGI